ncbi:MAG: imidazole glycerol phosphate synthase subunit HisH [Desulfobacterales bacterium]|nr:imidazole glycerol phosphate synthase subunit HisH [Desulfobacterales bacterium]
MIAIIDYDAGNLTSVERAVKHLDYPCVVTNDMKEIESAERVIFPGVGAAGSAMESLSRLNLGNALKSAVDSGKPVLGICLGTQIIMGHSDENDTPCLGFVDGNVRMFPDGLTEEGRKLKIPHMGWNRIQIKIDHPILSGVQTYDEFYFVHGYYPEPSNSTHVIATTEYGLTFSSVIGHDNIIATQFHPEKSGEPGLRILKNFCEWKLC